MRHHAKVVTGLAALAVLPALSQRDELELLESALADTIRSIEVLASLQERAAGDPEGSKSLLISSTEAPHLADAELDARLDGLRNEVSLLQMELDAIDSLDAVEAPGGDARAAMVPSVTPGLDDSLRAALQSSVLPPAKRASEGYTPVTDDEGAVVAPRAEPVGYSADPFGQARASFYAGHFGAALRLLEGRDDTASAYLRSRCLTRLDRFDEAIELLTKIVAEKGDSYEGRRAATDIEFVRWKKEFAGKLPKALRKSEAQR